MERAQAQGEPAALRKTERRREVKGEVMSEREETYVQQNCWNIGTTTDVAQFTPEKRIVRVSTAKESEATDGE